MGVSIIGGSSGGGPSVSLEQYIPSGATATLVDSGYAVDGSYTTASLSAGTYLLMANSNSANQAMSFRWNAANRSYHVASTYVHQSPAQTIITTTTATTFSIVNRNTQFNTLGRALRADSNYPDGMPPSIGYANGYYFTARRQLSDNLTNAFMYSTDLSNWSFANTHTSSGTVWPFHNGVAFVNGFHMVFNGTNSGSQKPRIWLSTNLTDWSPQSVTSMNNGRRFISAAFGNNRYLVALDGEDSDRLILYSTNLSTWTNCTTTMIQPGGLAFGTHPGYFVIAGSSTLRTSTDADTWTTVSGSWFRNDFDIFGYAATAYGNQRFVVSTQAGRIWTSTNATTWTQGPDLIDIGRNDSTPGYVDITVSFDTTNNVFVLTDNWNTGLYYTSTDGTNWRTKGYMGGVRIGHSFVGNYIHNIESTLYKRSAYMSFAAQGVAGYGIQPINFAVYRITGIPSV